MNPVLNIDLHKRILEGLSSAVLLFNKQLHLTYANPAAEMMFAVSARHIIGLPLSDLIQSTKEPLLPALEESLKNIHPFTRHELPILLLLDKEVTVDMTVVPMLDSGGINELLIEMTIVDRWLRITRDEQRMEQQKVTQEILRGLAHEIKNPLGGLRGAAQLLEKEFDNDDLKEYTQVIISEADRLQALVNRILGPSKLPKKQLVNIHEILERVRSLVLIEVSHGIRIHRNYDPSIPDVNADPEMLIQAMLNIVRNACEALGETGNITLRTRVVRKFNIGEQRHNLVANIEIIDDGPGIPADIRENIFFPMVTGRADGTGLGLAITQSLIQQHDGLIECQSEPGKTVFSVILPID